MRISKIYGLAVLLLMLLAAGSFAQENRLVVELDDQLARDVRNERLRLSDVPGLESYDIGFVPLFMEPNDNNRRRIWHDLGMNRWFRVTGNDKSINLLTDNSVIGKDIISFEIIKPDKKLVVPNDYSNYNMWGLERMGLPGAWDIVHNDAPSPVKISTIDTGTKIDHPDLAGNIFVNPGEDLNGNGIWDPSDIDGVDNDLNGYIDDISGWDFVSYIPSDPEMAVGEDYFPPDNEVFPDIDGHGTHVAGTAGAVSNNGAGVSSASWNVTSMPLKAGFAWIDPADGQEYGLGYGDDFASAIQYAVDNGSRIVSISFGGTSYYEPYAAAVAYARANNVILFAAAGNENYSTLTYPAAYDGAIAVAATNGLDAKADFSNFGGWVDISAPGTNIWSTMSNSFYAPWDYVSYQGTSMACPNAAAVAALILSYDPMLTDDEVEQLLYSTADDIYPSNPGYVGQLGAGLVNAEAALMALAETNFATVYIPDGSFDNGGYPEIRVSGFEDVAGLEFHIVYDSNVYSVNNVNLNPAISNATVNLEPGVVHIVWAGIPEALTLADETILATLEGSLAGMGGQTSFDFTQASILSDLNGNPYPGEFIGGWYEGYPEFSEVYIPDGMFGDGQYPEVMVANFENVAGIELHIGFDSNVYSVTDIALDASINDATVNIEPGMVHVIWAGVPGTVSLPDGAVLATLEGHVTGMGGVTTFDFGYGSLLSDYNGNEFPTHFVNGTWEGYPEFAEVYIPGGVFELGQFPQIRVANFEEVAGLELHIGYDSSVYSVSNVMLNTAIENATVNIQSGMVHIIWAGIPETLTLPDNTVLATLQGHIVGHGGQTMFDFAPTSLLSDMYGERYPANFSGGWWEGYGQTAEIYIPDGTFTTGMPQIFADGFTGVAGLELHVSYDASVFQVQNVTLHPDISNAAVNIADGLIHVVWAGVPELLHFPDHTLLATFEGAAVGGDGTSFEFEPYSMLSDEYGNPYPVNFSGGFWQGTGTGAMVTIPSGSFDSGEIPEVVVYGINEVAGLEYHIEYDNTVYDILQVNLHPDIDDAVVNVMDGVIHIVWAGVPNLLTLPDETVLASFAGLVADGGGLTEFNFLPTSIMSDASGSLYQAVYAGGTWQGTGTNEFAIVRIPDGSFNTDIPPQILVEGFNNIAGIELHIQYDPTVYDMTGVGLHPDIADAIINIMDGIVHIVWAGIPNTVTLADNDVLATLEGGVIGEGGATVFDFLPNSILSDDSGQQYPTLFVGGYWSGGPGPNLPPDPFDMLTPENGSEFFVNTIDLSWDVSTDPNGDLVRYNVYVSDAPIDPESPGNPVNDTPVQLTEHTFTAEMPGTHFWRVLAMDTNGGVTWANQDNWSFDANFNIAPEPFDLLLPEDGSVFEIYDIDLTWEESIDANGDPVTYDLFVGDAPIDPENPGDPVNAAPLGITEFAYQAAGNGTFFWHVRASDDSDGQTWANQDSWSFSISVNASPAGFDLLLPENGSVIEMVNLDLTWEDNGDPDGDPVTYDVFIGDAPIDPGNPGDPVNAAPLTVSDYAFQAAGNGTFFWHVRASDDSDGVTWANQDNWSFTIDVNIAPDPFNQLTPVDETVFDVYDVEMSWEAAGDANGDPVTYDVFVSSLPVDPADPGDPANGAALADPAFAYQAPSNGTYFWRVRAADNRNGVTWSEQIAWSFDVAVNLPPSAFNLLLPEDDDQITFAAEDFAVDFVWEASHDPNPGDQVRYDAFMHVVGADPQVDIIYHLPGLPDTAYTVSIPDSLLGEEVFWNEPFFIEWWVGAISNEDTTWCNDVFDLTLMEHPNSIDNLLNGAIPTTYSIERVYPNPFNPTVNIVVAVPEISKVNVTIFDVLGRQIEVLGDNRLEAGYHNFVWQAEGPSGMYFVRVVSPEKGFSQIRKMMYVK